MAARAGLSLGEQCARAWAWGECLALVQLYFVSVCVCVNAPMCDLSCRRYLRVHNPRVMTSVGRLLWRHCEETHAFAGQMGTSRHRRPGRASDFLQPLQKSVSSIPPTIPISIKMGPGSPNCPILVFNDAPQSRGVSKRLRGKPFF